MHAVHHDEINAECQEPFIFVIYPSYFTPHVRWLRSFTPVTYYSKLLGTLSLAAFLQRELFWV